MTWEGFEPGTFSISVLPLTQYTMEADIRIRYFLTIMNILYRIVQGLVNKTDSSQTHFGFTNHGSEMVIYRVRAKRNFKFWFGSPCITIFIREFFTQLFYCSMNFKVNSNIQGDPNQNLKFLLAIILKLCISDPLLVKPKCVLEVYIYFDFQLFVYNFQLFVYNFSK